MGSLEEQKRLILPFLQRATEIEKHDPKVAYYCRLYAVEQGLAIPNRDPKINGILTALLAKLEHDKTQIHLAGPEEDGAYVEDFAFKVFARADKVDRAGLADKKTAVTFLAAFYFLEILNQFGELSPGVIEKQKYAAWKAAEINKAIREGRTPAPGPPGVSQDTSGTGVPPDAPDNDFGLPTPPPLSYSHQPAEPGPPPPPALPSGPPEHAAAAQEVPFRPGSHVWYSEDCGSSGVVQGTVAALEHTEGGILYAVALPDRILRVPGQHLVHKLEPADVALYVKAEPPVEFTVEQVDAGHWPPSYVIKLEDGTHKNVSAEHLVPARSTSSQSRVAPPPPGSLAPHTAASLDASVAGYNSPPRVATPPDYPAEPFPPSTAHMQPPTLPQHQPQHSSYGAVTGTSPPTRYAGPAGHAPFQSAANTAIAPGRHQAVQQSSLSTSSLGSAPAASASSLPASTLLAIAPGSAFKPDLAAISESQKHAKYAASSLSFEDVSTAIKHLTTALQLLTQPGSGHT